MTTRLPHLHGHLEVACTSYVDDGHVCPKVIVHGRANDLVIAPLGECSTVAWAIAVVELVAWQACATEVYVVAEGLTRSYTADEVAAEGLPEPGQYAREAATDPRITDAVAVTGVAWTLGPPLVESAAAIVGRDDHGEVIFRPVFGPPAGTLAQGLGLVRACARPSPSPTEGRALVDALCATADLLGLFIARLPSGTLTARLGELG